MEHALKKSVTFNGANHSTEIETVEEFLLKIEGRKPSAVQLKGWNFTQVDFSKSSHTLCKTKWDQFCMEGANFWGCTFPSFTCSAEVRQRGATVMDQPDNLPFKPYRAFMYRQNELQAHDESIYELYCKCSDPFIAMHQSMHDFFIEDALLDYLEGKTVVGIMGGHAMTRSDDAYREVVRLGFSLARNGFVVATGGGPGAMEAANLGAYLFERDEEEVEEAVDIIANTKDPSLDPDAPEYMNTTAAQQVIDRFGDTCYAPSLGIPTWRYGHEPSNMFATWHAKMFSNAVREDGLIAIANGGIIYTPGSVGTNQEIFQAVCRNHYASLNRETPMIFLKSQFWESTGVYNCILNGSKGKDFLDWMTMLDDKDDAVAHLVKFRHERNLPVVTQQMLQANHWEKSSPNWDSVDDTSCVSKAKKNRRLLHRASRQFNNH